VAAFPSAALSRSRKDDRNMSSPTVSASSMLAEYDLTEDETFVGSYTSEAERAALTVPQIIMAAWAANDANMFASVFTENGSLLMQDDQLTSRDQIRDYMAKGFETGLKGARVTGWPMNVVFLSDDSDAALVVTQGGIMLAGESAIAPEREIRAIWTLVADNDKWRLLSHHSCPIR
jgi:uncharacterized protein (TIGR02246 family)